MELIHHPLLEHDSSEMLLPFIEANTIPITLHDISSNHIIPVFTKDNQTLISQHQFIEATYNELSSFSQNAVVGPFIRVSHPIKGRVPSAKYKRNDELLINEETIYFERMMFVYLIPSISRMVNEKSKLLWCTTFLIEVVFVVSFNTTYY